MARRRIAAVPESTLPDLAPYAGLVLAVGWPHGDRLGEHRMPARDQPGGIEVERFVPYVPGDDLRHLDWNVLARLDTLVVRRFVAEREVELHLLVDASASMALPAADDKRGAAREVALALAVVALAGNDAVRLTLLERDGVARTSPLVRQRTGVRRLAAFLDAVEAGGTLDLGRALAAYAQAEAPGAIVIVTSDLLMDPAGLEPGLAALRARRHLVSLVRIVGQRELDPTRDVTHGVLEDAETGAQHPVALTPATLARYGEVWAAHDRALRATAERAGAAYAELVTGTPVPAFVTGDLARLGIVRSRSAAA